MSIPFFFFTFGRSNKPLANLKGRFRLIGFMGSPYLTADRAERKEPLIVVNSKTEQSVDLEFKP